MPGRAPYPGWQQLNIALRRPENGDEPSAHALFRSVFDLSHRMERDGLLDGFFFTRKRPGIRLRFAACDLDSVAAEIRRCAEALQREEAIGNWFVSCYEPETFQFGGPEAMELVHAHFFSDTFGWWEHEQLVAAGRATLGREVLSLAMINDLFLRVLDGAHEEVWDAWCHLAVLHGMRELSHETDVPAVDMERLFERVPAPEGAILRRYAAANAALARGLGELHESGKLLFRYRLILPHVALVHWNRFAFTLNQRERMYRAMTAAWSPNGHLCSARSALLLQKCEG